jgi:hypothetical protein
MPASDQAPLTIQTHPPERGQPAGAGAPPAGCCCCCCCCLHTLGGLIGAVSGSVSPIAPRPLILEDEDSPFPFRRDIIQDEGPFIPATLLYWMLVSFLIGVTTVAAYVKNGAANPQDLGLGLLLAFMILPALQLGASLLSCVVIGLFYPAKGVPLVRIGRITLWSFVGTGAGLLVMGGCCGILSLAK